MTPILANLGGILGGVGGIAFLVYWIWSLVKMFKAKDTIWGILAIFFSPLVGIIYGFVKKDILFAVIGIVVVVLYGAAYGSIMSQLSSIAG